MNPVQSGFLIIEAPTLSAVWPAMIRAGDDERAIGFLAASTTRDNADVPRGTFGRSPWKDDEGVDVGLFINSGFRWRWVADR